eukprot:TRINITY_DN715_c0_g2_i1.p2 TRINITY_DN715_c0_g2~~TRINITY_DN715_c0_g2_i1.p2  ORF type:complete len:226 (-),score=69.54 TRINITY_DN715_c0_g2_i1:104-781(-)
MVRQNRSSALPAVLVALGLAGVALKSIGRQALTFTGTSPIADAKVALTAASGDASSCKDVVTMEAFKYKDGDRTKYDGATRKMFLKRLKHRRWAAQSKYPRIFGYVEKWDDEKGEGIVRDQEKTQNYLVIRDEIGRCYHNHKSLQRCEMVEFFASEEVDATYNLPMALNVSGPFGEHVKGCEEYRNRMLWTGQFPKRWSDNVEDFPDKKKGEWYINKRKGGDDEE